MTDKDQLILENLRLLWDRKIAPESALDFIHNVLSYPTQDGTAEENIESYWIESDDLGGGMHLMVFKSDYIRAMHRYAAPLRSEIERLKSELAASVSPKLVLPKGKRLKNPSRIEGTYEEGFNGCLYELRRLNPHIADCLDTKQEKRYKMPLSAEFEEEKYFTKVKMPYGTFNSDK